MALREQIRSERENAGLSQEELAAASGIARHTILRIENGSNSKAIDQLERIADALGKRIVLEDKEGQH